MTTELVLNRYLKDKAIRNSLKPPSHDPLTACFTNMADTVKTFSTLDQIQIKSQLFELILSAETRLAQEIQFPK